MSIIRKDIPCVYFYMKDNEVLYIGKSYNLKARHREHIKRHDLCLNNYNKLAVQYYSSQIILPSIELFYISLFDPIYNQRDKYVLEDEHIDNYWRIIETFFIEECTLQRLLTVLGEEQTDRFVRQISLVLELGVQVVVEIIAPCPCRRCRVSSRDTLRPCLSHLIHIPRGTGLQLYLHTFLLLIARGVISVGTGIQQQQQKRQQQPSHRLMV